MRKDRENIGYLAHLGVRGCMATALFEGLRNERVLARQ